MVHTGAAGVPLPGDAPTAIQLLGSAGLPAEAHNEHTMKVSGRRERPDSGGSVIRTIELMSTRFRNSV